jgi:hypothetical protein
MNVILYTADFEPITVIDLPRWLLDRAEQQGAIRIAIKGGEKPDVITAYCKKIHWHDGSLKSILVTKDEVFALALAPTWLPGQIKVVQNSSRLLHRLHSKIIELMRKN